MRLVRDQHPGIAFNAHYIVNGNIVFKNACALGCGGIVSKRLITLAGRPVGSRSETRKHQRLNVRPKRIGRLIEMT
jgi:hypothetical protein